MLERAFARVTKGVSQETASAVLANKPEVLSAVSQVMPALQEAKNTVFTVLGDFGDVPLPQQQTEEQLWPQEFTGIVQTLHDGFTDAQRVLVNHIARAAANNDTQALEHALAHTTAVADAWKSVQGHLEKPSIRKALLQIEPTSSISRQDTQPQTVWDRLTHMLLAEPPQSSQIHPTGSLWQELADAMDQYADRSAADMLREMRLSQTMTQSEVAQVHNKSLSYMSAVERGQINPSLQGAIEILRATHQDPRQSILPIVWLVKIYEEYPSQEK